MKGILVGAQQRTDGTGRVVDAPFTQLFAQQGLRDLTMMMLVEHVAAQRRTKAMFRQ
jgi:hypothetical protein